jgi:hypothetical protein
MLLHPSKSITARSAASLPSRAALFLIGPLLVILPSISLLYCLYSRDSLLVQISRLGQTTPADDLFLASCDRVITISSIIMAIGTIISIISVSVPIFNRTFNAIDKQIPSLGTIVAVSVFIGVFGWLGTSILSLFIMNGKDSAAGESAYEAKVSYLRENYLAYLLPSVPILTMHLHTESRPLARDSVLIVECDKVGVSSDMLTLGNSLTVSNSDLKLYFFEDKDLSLPALPHKMPHGLIVKTKEYVQTGYATLSNGSVPGYICRMHFYAVDLDAKALVGHSYCDGGEWSLPWRKPGGGVTYISGVYGGLPSDGEQYSAIESLLQPLPAPKVP